MFSPILNFLKYTCIIYRWIANYLEGANLPLALRCQENPSRNRVNINHLSSKIGYLRGTCSKSPIDILSIVETKLDSSYPDAQFQIPDYQYPPYRKDRNKNGGGKIVFIRKGLITKRLKAFEGDISEMICLEVTISKKIWFITYVYRHSYNNNKDIFFSELSNTLSLATRKYENILIIGDLNIDTSNKKKDNVTIYPIYVMHSR